MWSRLRDRIAGLFARKQDTSENAVAEVSNADAAPAAEEAATDDATFGEAQFTDGEARFTDAETQRIDEPTVSDTPVSSIDHDVGKSEAEADIAESEPAAVAPPDDFKFPWTRPEGDPSVEPVPEAIPLLDTAPDTFDALAEPQAESTPKAGRPGFFARLFGRKTKDVPLETTPDLEIEPAAATDDAPVVAEAMDVEMSDVDLAYEASAEQPTYEAPPDLPIYEAPPDRPTYEAPPDLPTYEAPQELPTYDPPSEPQIVEDTFASVEDALPVADDAFFIPEDVPDAPAKPGLFSRLFRRGSKETRRPSLEIEVHEDRIEAAAQALDDVGEEQFESFEGKSSVTEETFESVDEALPSPSLEGLPMIGDFAPPASDHSLIEADVVDDTLDVPPIGERGTAEADVIEDTLDVPPIGDRATAEVDVVVDDVPPIGERTTDEVDLAELPALPLDNDAEAEALAEATTAFDGESTLEIEEKTDEFEVVPPPAPPGDEEKVDTLEVDRKSFWTKSFIGKLFRRGDTEVEKVGAKETEAAEEKQAVFLLAKFRAFYNEIIRFQHQKSEFTAGFATAIVTEYAADQSPDAAAEGLSKRLSELLELQAAEAKWMGGEAAERYPDAQYAMAALADETFEHMEWDGQPSWPKVSLERRIYQTNAADVELFRRIDKLLKESPDSVVARDLARVYLLVLAAGFQGKWRPFGLTRPVAEYRRRLYEYIHNDDALMLYGAERKIFPDAASRTLEGAAVSRFSAAQRWAAILLFLVISYTVIAHIAWNRVSADLKDVTARIKSGGAAGVR
jgi:type IV/VI secretion system ImpK/VasF family protein